MRGQKKRLGEMLIEAGLINELQLISAIGQQRQWGGRVGSLLIRMGFVDEQSVASVLEKQRGEKCISLLDKEIPQEALNAVKYEVAKKYCIVPINLDKRTLTIAMSDPTNLKTLDELSFMLGLKIKPLLALESEIKSTIAQYYEGVKHDGKVHRIDTEKIAENMHMLRNEPIITPLPKEIPERAIKKETTIKTILEAVVTLLMDKGLITKEEFVKRIEEIDNQ